MYASFAELSSSLLFRVIWVSSSKSIKGFKTAARLAPIRLQNANGARNETVLELFKMLFPPFIRVASCVYALSLFPRSEVFYRINFCLAGGCSLVLSPIQHSLKAFPGSFSRLKKWFRHLARPFTASCTTHLSPLEFGRGRCNVWWQWKISISVFILTASVKFE